MRKIFLVALIYCLGVLVTACGGGSSNTENVPAAAPTSATTPSNTSFTVGGTVSGLNGSLSIKNNGTDQLTVNTSGQFIFATPTAQGGQYNVTITSQPSTQICTLTNYFGTNVTANITTIVISCVDNPPATTTLSISTTSLALAASGNPRILILTNTGTETAPSINMTSTPALPTGTSKSTTCSASLAPGSSCAITITPGFTPNSAVGSTSVASAMAISGSNTNNVSADIYVLTYGNIYQSGYIFSIDDLTATTSSIGGKVFSLSNQSPAAHWSPDNFGIGVTELSTAPPCNGASDGQCNTSLIVGYYSSTPSNSYAAGLCKSTINGYADWYLPAICEMNSSSTVTCSAQNDIQSKLITTNIIPLNANYWSSTEYAASGIAWFSNLSTSGGGSDFFSNKNAQLVTRCARKLTN